MDIARPDWLDDISGWVVDVDGCLVQTSRAGGAGGTAMAGATAYLQLLADRGDEVLVCTNASQSPPQHYADHLRSLGLPVAGERFVTAGSAAAEHIAHEHPGEPVLVVGDMGLSEPLRRRGVRLVDPTSRERASVVVVGALDLVTADLLNAACLAVEAGAPLYTTVYSPWFHGGQGHSVAVSAAVAASIAWVTDTAPIVCGKPSRHLAASLRRALDRPASQIAVVGDARAEIGLARAMGARSVLVTSGAISRDQVADLPPDLTPDLVLDDVAALHAVLASPRGTD